MAKQVSDYQYGKLAPALKPYPVTNWEWVWEMIQATCLFWTAAQRGRHVRARDVRRVKSEATVQSEIRAEAPLENVRLWRNNNGACVDDTGRTIRYGLGNDSAQLQKRFTSSDLIGINRRGRFVAIECKAEGWVMPGDFQATNPHVHVWSMGRNPTDREAAQHAFHQVVRASGGVAGFASSVEEFKRLLMDNGA